MHVDYASRHLNNVKMNNAATFIVTTIHTAEAYMNIYYKVNILMIELIRYDQFYIIINYFLNLNQWIIINYPVAYFVDNQ